MGSGTEFIPKSLAHHKIEFEIENGDPIVEPSKNKPKLAKKSPTQDSDANANTPLPPLSDPNRASALHPMRDRCPKQPTHMQQVAPCLHVDR